MFHFGEWQASKSCDRYTKLEGDLRKGIPASHHIPFGRRGRPQLQFLSLDYFVVADQVPLAQPGNRQLISQGDLTQSISFFNDVSEGFVGIPSAALFREDERKEKHKDTPEQQ